MTYFCRRLLGAMGLALAMSATAHATGAIQNVDIQCSDTLSLNDNDGLSLSCTGDLTLRGLAADAAIVDELAIHLLATGALSLDALLLQAPALTITADRVSLSASTVLDTGGGPVDIGTLPDSGALGGGSIGWSRDQLGAAGSVQLGGNVSTVPEPATGVLGLLTLGAISLVRRRVR